jgi:hypothetical protein
MLPKELVAEIDLLVGPRGRSGFLAEVARAEVRKRKLLAILERKEPIWKEEDHPELKDGAYAWVRSMRDENERRMERINARRDEE